MKLTPAMEFAQRHPETEEKSKRLLEPAVAQVPWDLPIGLDAITRCASRTPQYRPDDG